MLDIDQVVPSVNIWNVLRTPVLHDWDGCTANNLLRLLSTFVDFTNNRNLNLASTFVAYLLNEEAPNLVQWSPAFDAEYPVNARDPNLLQLTTPKSRFDFDCSVLVSAAEALADYISESGRKAREYWRRFYRENILSSAVSKDGHVVLPSKTGHLS